MAISGGTAEEYSQKTGFIYIFNLIVGTGALALPAAFSKAGWLLGTIIIILLSFISFMTVTFVIEAMSIANAIIYKTRKARLSVDDRNEDSIETHIRQLTNRSTRGRARDRERDPLIPPEFGDQNEDIRRQNSTASTFEINQCVEMGRMASMFLSKTGLSIFYICLCIYLYGDLAIYITAVATSLRDIICSSVNITGGGVNGTNSSSDILPDTEASCWSEEIAISRYEAYRMFTIVFIVLLGPFTFLNVQKTKYLQMFTTSMRWAALILMISLATIKLIQGQGEGHPSTANVLALPNFFGICVYSFMCHHSLPSLVTPIASKKRIFQLFTLDYFLITGFYLLLALTGIFAFDKIKDLYTLNFEPNHGEEAENVGILQLFLQYFLSLFPVFTLSTNFPIIAITLRNNLKTLFNLSDEEDDDDFIDDIMHSTTDSVADDNNITTSENSGVVNSTTATAIIGTRRRSTTNNNNCSNCCFKLCSLVGFPLLAIAPPFTIAFFVENVQILVSVTGSFAGAIIQYIVPIALVYQARKLFSTSTIDMNPYASPFRHVLWIWFVLIWSIICIGFVTVNYILHPIDSTPVSTKTLSYLVF